VLSLAVFLSGGGRSLQNLLDRTADGRLSAKVSLVVSDRPGAQGLERARSTGIRAVVVRRKDYPNVEPFSAAIFEECRRARVELVCMAGFLQLLRISDDFAGRVMNIHPALLPAFGGKGMYGHHVHEAVLEYGCKVSGCTVHFADNVYDHGPVILQRTVEVRDDDTAETLADRVFGAECDAYPEAIRLFEERKLRIDDRQVRIRI
jgi:formyltetrahydrofolate-dependent phosphoribosylglycinamide formyltransferase